MRFRLISQVRPPYGASWNDQTQLPSFDRTTSVRSGTTVSTRMVEPGIRISSPTSRCWSSGMIVSVFSISIPSRRSIQS